MLLKNLVKYQKLKKSKQTQYDLKSSNKVWKPQASLSMFEKFQAFVKHIAVVFLVLFRRAASVI